MDGADLTAHAKAELRRLVAARRSGAEPRPAPDARLGPSAGTGPRTARAGGAGIAGRVLALPEVTNAVWVAAFVGLPGEPDTRPLLAALRARGARVLLPAVREDLDLDFREFTGALVPGALGTREPPPAAPAVELAAADVVLVPAVAVDRHGRRLGRGGGSYDRALRRVRPEATLVAVVDDLAIVDSVPVDAHDLSVSVIVTPTQVVRRGPV
ncbi:5-formyltetrahydrofolate cyclo-ligase [Pseudofrankia sp. EUN1h]|nr:5-formyltetrahydrofolate cyclo-ligase [Pseudofrankia sp. EUN1h]